MKALAALVALGLLAQGQPQDDRLTQPVVVVPTHGELTKDERAILNLRDRRLIVEQATKHKLQVVEFDKGVFVYSPNLFGLKSIEDQLIGMETFLRIARLGGRTVRLSDLQQRERDSLVDLLAKQNQNDDVGVALKRDETRLGIVVRSRLTMSDGRRDLNVSLFEKQRDAETPSEPVASTPEQVSDFRNERQADERFAIDLSTLRFKYSLHPGAVGMADRLRLVSAFNEHCAKLIEAQMKAHDDLQKALLEALNPKGLPQPGSKVSALDPNDISYLISALRVQYGYGSDEEARAYLERAVVKSTRVVPMAVIRIMVNGQMIEQSINITVSRPRPPGT